MPKVIPPANTAEELHEKLTDRATMKELLQDPSKLVDFVEGSVQARIKNSPDINDQIGEQTTAFMTQWLKDNAQGVDDLTMRRLNLANPTSRNAMRKNTVYNKKAIGASHDDKFESLTDYFHSISDHAARDATLSTKLTELKNAMSSLKPSDGGFLIPEVLRAELLRISLEKSIVRSRARVIPMDSLTVPFPMVDSTSNVSSVYGGVVGYWTEEGATLTESKPRFGRVELRANKLTLYTEIPNELIRDAQPSMEAFINDIFPEAMAWFEDVAFFLGGGVGEPLGFLNAPAAISITRAVGNQSIDWVDVAAMYSRMLPGSLDRAVWVVSPDVIANLLTMPFVAGATNAVPILLAGTGNVTPTLTILGRPVIVSEKAKAIGTAGDINFVDFGFYLVGDRQAMSARQSEDFRFNQDVIAFRVIERVDGRPWLASAITPQNGGSTLSPFVKLA